MTDNKLISAAKRDRDLEQEDSDALWAEFRRRNLYASGPYDDVMHVLVDIPRPRPVRMSFKGQFMGLLAAGLLGLVGYVARLFAFAKWDVAGFEGAAVNEIARDERGQHAEENHSDEKEMADEKLRDARPRRKNMTRVL